MNRRIVIWGPPDSGKTTYAQQHAQPGDLVWDFDHIVGTMMRSGLPAGSTEFPLDVIAAVRSMRDALIAWLRSTHYTVGDVYLIVTHEATARRISDLIDGELIAPAERT